ncbi:MAG: hypothetical protein ACXABY_04655 [Candidatus Thorarchaeota archaeon]|jgi:hypothetical protein
MPTSLVVRTNVLQTEDVLIRDMGVIIPGNGGSDTFTVANRLEEARQSIYLRNLTTDQKFGTNGSTLIMSDGVDEVEEEDASVFLDEIPNVRNNYWLPRDPTPQDDETLGYVRGSAWVNASTQVTFTCVSALEDNALWKRVSFNINTPGGTSPDEIMYGSLLDYPRSGNVTSGEIQYVRVHIDASVVVKSFRTFVDSGGFPSRNIKMGLYDQTVPSDKTLGPNARIAQTNEIDTNGTDGLFVDANVSGGNYVIPATGFYWLAIVTDSPSIKFALSEVYRKDFLPVRRESGAGTSAVSLPTVASGLTNPVSSLIYVALVEL